MSVLLPGLSGMGAGGDRVDSVSVGGAALSFEALAARAHTVGAAITGAGVVAVDATATLDTVVAVCAGLAAGVAVVPVPPDAGPVERAHILRDSSATAVLGAPDWASVDLPRIDLTTAIGSGSTALPEPPSDATALIMYTSGTTGLPKGAVLSRRAIAAGLDGLAEAWGWTADDHLVHGLPLFHVHGLILGVLGALRVGSRLTHTGRPTPAAYAAAAGSLYFGVPTVWSRVCAEPDAAAALHRARLLVSGSAPLPVPVFDRLHELTGHRPVERYGMTETLITLSTRADGERRPGWVGLPIAGVQTRLVADDGTAVDHDGETIGGLQVRGRTLFDGYLTGGRP
ncbi:MAG TPA: AMP-binding protein, partial [Ilumatobacteraceae bacterium]|nr:AMP-binding protein [Ilumatobacteraceae bacterium]